MPQFTIVHISVLNLPVLMLISLESTVIEFVKSRGIEIRFSSEDSFRSDLVDLLSIYSAVDKVGVNRVSTFLSHYHPRCCTNGSINREDYRWLLASRESLDFACNSPDKIMLTRPRKRLE